MLSMRERPAAVKGSRPAGLPNEAAAGATASALPRNSVHVPTAWGRQATTPTRTRTRTWRDGGRPPPPPPRSLPPLVQRHGTLAAPWTPQERIIGGGRTSTNRALLTATLIISARFQFSGQPGCLRQRSHTPSPGGGWTPVTERLRSGVPGRADMHARRSMVGQTRTLFHVKQSTPAVALRSRGRSGR